MIRRETSDGDLLITQDDHAILSGALLERWGNDQFQRAESASARWPSVRLAAQLHDAGWRLHDDAPTLNQEGRPLDVFESTWGIAVRVWAASADRAAEADPYAGLLVSLHVLTLSHELLQSAAQRRPGEDDAAGKFAMNKFQHREIERQEQLREKVGLVATTPLALGLAPTGSSADEDLLRLHFRAVQAADSLSLGLCCTQPPRKTRDVHASWGAGPIVLEQTRGADGALRVTPWPLDHPFLNLTVAARRLPSRRWESEAEFQAAYAAAPEESAALRICAE